MRCIWFEEGLLEMRARLPLLIYPDVGYRGQLQAALPSVPYVIRDPDGNLAKSLPHVVWQRPTRDELDEEIRKEAEQLQGVKREKRQVEAGPFREELYEVVCGICHKRKLTKCFWNLDHERYNDCGKFDETD